MPQTADSPRSNVSRVEILTRAVVEVPRSGKKRKDPNWDHLHVTIPTKFKALYRAYCDEVGVTQQELLIAVLADFFAQQGFSLTELYGATMPPGTRVDASLLQELMETGATPKERSDNTDS